MPRLFWDITILFFLAILSITTAVNGFRYRTTKCKALSAWLFVCFSLIIVSYLDMMVVEKKKSATTEEVKEETEVKKEFKSKQRYEAAQFDEFGFNRGGDKIVTIKDTEESFKIKCISYKDKEGCKSRHYNFDRFCSRCGKKFNYKKADSFQFECPKCEKSLCADLEGEKDIFCKVCGYNFEHIINYVKEHVGKDL